MKRFACIVPEFALKHPKAAAIILFLCYGLALAMMPRYAVDNSLEIWFDRDDSAVGAYNAFQSKFGNDETILVFYRDPKGVVNATHLLFMRRVADSLSSIEGIHRVTTLADLPDIDLMVSDDRTTALIVVEPETFEQVDRERPRIVAAVRESLEREFSQTDWVYRLAGIGVIYDALNRATSDDSLKLFGASYALMVLLVILLVRSTRLIVFCLTSVAFAVTAAVGIFLATGTEFTMLTIILPSVVTIYSVSDLLHIIHSFRITHRRYPELDSISVARRSLERVAVPCLITSITTAAGFLSLSLSSITVVRDLGAFCAVGVVVAYLSAQLIMGIGLRSMDLTKISIPAEKSPRVQRIQRSKAVVPFVVIVVAVASLGIFRLKVDTYSLELLSRKHPVRIDSEAIEREFGPYTPIEVLVSGTSVDGKLAAGARSIANRMTDLPLMTDPISVVDFTRGITSESTEAVTKEILSNVDRRAILGLVDFESAAFRVSGRIRMQSARGFKASIESVLDTDLPEGISAAAAGYLPLYVRIMRAIPSTQLFSSLAALVTIFCLFALFARSARLVAAAMIANVIPIILVLGIMGWSGIPLDLGTVTITAVTLGIISDDTIHMINAIKRSRGGDDSGDARVSAVLEARMSILKPMLSTTLVLGLGFAVLMFSTVASVARFGILTALILAAALLCDMYVLPYLYAGVRGGAR